MKTWMRILAAVLAVVLICGPAVPLSAQAVQSRSGYMTLQQAGAIVAEKMAQRAGPFTVSFRLEDSRNLTQAQIWEMLLSEAFKPSGKGSQGEILRWSYDQVGYQIEDDFDGQVHYVTAKDIRFVYYSSAAEEQALTNKINQIFAELDIASKSDYEKVEAIYQYICEHIDYSEAFLQGNVQSGTKEWGYIHSAYSLIYGEAVCQGFCSIVYRMMTDAGLDCQLVTGDIHGWNIVKLGDQYYCLDATWDDNASRENYNWFLLGTANFRRWVHMEYSYCATPEFMARYPVSALDYGAPVPDAGAVIGSGSCGENVTWVLTGDGTMTIRGTGPMWDRIKNSTDRDEIYGNIKKVVIEEGVTSIGADFFYNCPQLTSVQIPSSVTTIGDFAFALCDSLKTITLPDSVTQVGRGVFTACWRLEEANLSAGMTRISTEMFAQCQQLKTVRIPQGIQVIGGDAFTGCESLGSITIPQSVTTIEYDAFASAFDPKAGVTLVIPQSVTSVGNFAFAWCGLKEVVWQAKASVVPEHAFYFSPWLQKVTLADSVTNIGERAFADCANLQEMILPNGLKEMGTEVFTQCIGLEKLVFPGSLQTIPASTCMSCDKLTEVVLKEGIRVIDINAFSQCKALEQITFPASVTHIKNGAFAWSTTLKTMTFLGNAPDIAADGIPAFQECGPTAYYPNGNATWTSDKRQDYGSLPITWKTRHGAAEPHTGDGKWASNGQKHWQFCTGCDSKVHEGQHTWDGGVRDGNRVCYTCTACKYKRYENVSAGETNPDETQPGYTEPEHTEPTYTQPDQTEPTQTEPTETKPSEPEPQPSTAVTEPSKPAQPTQPTTPGEQDENSGDFTTVIVLFSVAALLGGGVAVLLVKKPQWLKNLLGKNKDQS